MRLITQKCSVLLLQAPSTAPLILLFESRSRAPLHAQPGFWNPPPSGGLDSPGVAQGEWQRAVWAYLYLPSSAAMWVRDRPLSVGGASRPTSTEYLAFLEWGFILPLGGIMWGAKVAPGGV